MAEESRALPSNLTRTVGREALRNNILAAKVIADVVKTTLGPKGMDKMLVDSSGNVTVTNDGVTILEEMELDHPAARLIVDIAKTQEQEVGDGTTTVAILAGALLEHAESLIDRRIHPTVIVKGYRHAAEHSLAILNELARDVEDTATLRRIAMTSMTGKSAEGMKESFSEVIVRAVERVAKSGEVELDSINIVKIRGARAEESELVEGVVIDKDVVHTDMPKVVRDASIALIDLALEVHGPETETHVTVSNAEQLREIVESEERNLKEFARSVIASGATVVFCQKGIDDVVQYYLAQEGIMAFRRVPRSIMERLAKATSGKIISHVHDLTKERLGYAQHVEEIRHGDQTLTYVRGCKNPRAVTILIYGSTPHVLDETERAMHDGLGVVSAAIKEKKVVSGGGAIEIELARRLLMFARTLQGKEQLAVEAFAHALERVPEALAENAGLDPIEIVTELRKCHEAGKRDEGLNLLNDRIENCFERGIIEPLKVKTQALSAATEVATTLLRIDDVLISKDKPMQREDSFSGMD